jgi:succinate dehydrogenase/fumarate reductase flavoprotein subunit
MLQRTLFHLGEVSLPVYSTNTVIIGSGAAALNCAEHLYRFFQERGETRPEELLCIVTAGLGAGASNCSGSDKQTYYKLGVQGQTPDTPHDFALTLTQGGCTHGDLALIEGENSLREFYHLVEKGVPFPHNERGGFVGYKTDHDPRQRATSAGPWTSRFMVQKSLAQVRRFGIPILAPYEAIALLTAGEGEDRRCVGVLAVNHKDAEEEGFGLTLFNAENVVMATGGPGEMYAVSVYPRYQMGAHGICFEAGAIAHNLTESQFGLASLTPRWNLSGTYQQVIPRYYSTDADGGNPREFLNDYFPSMRALATAIFLKGYQWPFDPDRAADFGSSLIDILVEHERRDLGRRVWMDFTRNPMATGRLEPFSLSDLEPEARLYLERSGALQETPIQRLERMNPPSIDLYRNRGVDLSREPLEIAVCAQHNNGGFAVDRWWESNVPHLFVIGEQAGTHGVKRPGGSALNAGQVGGLRAAQRIAHAYGPHVPSASEFLSAIGDTVAGKLEAIRAGIRRAESAPRCAEEVQREIQQRMTDFGGVSRSLEGASRAVDAARRLLVEIRRDGLRIERRRHFLRQLRVEAMCVAHLGYLIAIRDLIARGSGSRGSHIVADPKGILPHPALGSEWRFGPENPALREEILEVWLGEDGEFHTRAVPVRPIPESEFWFENTWEAYRSGRVFE